MALSPAVQYSPHRFNPRRTPRKPAQALDSKKTDVFFKQFSTIITELGFSSVSRLPTNGRHALNVFALVDGQRCTIHPLTKVFRPGLNKPSYIRGTCSLTGLQGTDEHIFVCMVEGSTEVYKLPCYVIRELLFKKKGRTDGVLNFPHPPRPDSKFEKYRLKKKPA